MMLFAPAHAGLWREAGMINAQLGNMKAAIAHLERFVAEAADAAQRRETAQLLQRLRARLQ
jgi:regulator of sirC expression with transglutaminase-like and TPR domain